MPVQAYNTRIFVDRWDFSGTSNAVAISIDAQSIEYNVFQDAATQFIAGDPTSKIEHSGYFNGPLASDLEGALYARLGEETFVGVILDTEATIPVGYVMPATYNGQMTIDSPVNELITIKATWPALNRDLYRGYQLWAGSVIATGAKTGVDFGSAGASGGKAWLFVHAIIGTPSNATITVQSDDNSGFTTPTTRGTFTFSGAAALEVDLATVERYMRFNQTSLGGATNVNSTLIVGVENLTY